MKQKEITFETARELGILKDDSLDYAYLAVEGCSILSMATDKAFEQAHDKRLTEVKKKYSFVYFNGEELKVI